MRMDRQTAATAAAILALSTAAGTGAWNRVLAKRLQEARLAPRNVPALPPEAFDVAETRRRLQEAERELAALRRSPPEPVAARAAVPAADETVPRERAEPAADEPRRPRSPEEFFQRMQAEQPERYQELRTRMAERRQRATDALARQTAFVLSLDAGLMDPGQREKHEALLETLRDLWEWTGNEDLDPTSPEAAERRRDLRETLRDLRPLLQAGRETALQQVGRQLGYDDAGARAFSAEILRILENTEPAWYGRGGGPPGRGRPGGAEGNREGP